MLSLCSIHCILPVSRSNWTVHSTAKGKQWLSINPHRALLESVTTGNLQVMQQSNRTSCTQLFVVLLARGRLFLCHPGNDPCQYSWKPEANWSIQHIFCISHPLWQSLVLSIFSCFIGQISLFQWFWFYCFMILEVTKGNIQSYRHTQQ